MGTVRHQALLTGVTRWTRPPAGRVIDAKTGPGVAVPPFFSRERRASHGRRLLTRAAIVAAVLMVVLSGALLLVREAHKGRVYPAVIAGGEALGGLTAPEAKTALGQRAAALTSAPVRFTYNDREWSAPLGDLGVTVDTDAAFARAYEIGREDGALGRLQSTAQLAREDQRIPLPVSLDHQPLTRWFDSIDRDLGMPPREAALAIDGTSVTIVPETDGTIVDRVAATAALVESLRGLGAVQAELPTISQPAAVRAADLTAARDQMARALSQSVQVTFGDAYWTLSPGDIGRFVKQRIDSGKRGAEAVSLTLDRETMAGWLDERLAPEINRQPADAVVGWNGGLVSVVESVNGVELNPTELAQEIEASFFGNHGPVAAPATITRPRIDSANLDRLGIVTLLGTGTSNYAGSTDGRATNVAVGAERLNGTLVPPGGEYSFNNSIGVINEENGFVEAQVIDGERIGQDIGGGICQVSTTVFRAAYLAGMPIGEWWPHRYQIPFYEYDGWPPGLDASILQPTEDPSTWGDFKFGNPSDGWLLVESWTNGVQVVVNIYGPDLGYAVDTTGPTIGEKLQIEPDLEIVDPELDAGTINHTESPQEGLEVSHYRVVTDRNSNIVSEGNFYTKYYPRGNVWQVSPDMKEKSPADPDRELPKPLAPPPDEAAMDDAAAGEVPVEEPAVPDDGT